VLGVLGTLLCFVFLFSACSFANYHFFDGVLTQSELMLLACVLCATDSVAVLGIVRAEMYPRLNSILFSEGIVNDATAIILFRTVLDYGAEIEEGLRLGTLALLVARFMALLVLSMAVGLGFGLLLTFYFRWQKREEAQEGAVQEVAMVMLTSYLCYLVAEMINLSGIIALFVCGVIMGSYCIRNLSGPAQRGTGLVLESLSYLAEGFIYVYLGLQVMSLPSNITAISFALILLPLMPLARVCALLALLVFIKLGLSKPLKWRDFSMLWYSGIMRGAIAFALSFQIASDNAKFLERIVLVLVLTTSLAIPLLSKVFTGRIGLRPEVQENEHLAHEDF
jgi:NhaP-type Na+/H+ or K+/H+ antiporter